MDQRLLDDLLDWLRIPSISTATAVPPISSARPRGSSSA